MNGSDFSASASGGSADGDADDPSTILARWKQALASRMKAAAFCHRTRPGKPATWWRDGYLLGSDGLARKYGPLDGGPMRVQCGMGQNRKIGLRFNIGQVAFEPDIHLQSQALYGGLRFRVGRVSTSRVYGLRVAIDGALRRH